MSVKRLLVLFPVTFPVNAACAAFLTRVLGLYFLSGRSTAKDGIRLHGRMPEESGRRKRAFSPSSALQWTISG